MWTETAFTEALGVRLPIVAAPMAGGPTTPGLVAAASAAGALGVLGAGYQTPDALRADIRAVRAATDAPFGVNLFVPAATTVSAAELEAGMRALTPYAEELDVQLTAPAAVGGSGADEFARQVEVVVSERVPFFSFTFGVPDAATLAAIRGSGALICGTATSVAEARALAAAGVDMICAQAGEAGGHRGGFIGDPAQSAVGLVSLVPLICDAVGVPVIAGGGIMDGRGIAAALTLGAAAAQLGTAFLLTPEAGTSAPFRAAVQGATETDTVLTTAFSGKPARGIANRMARDLAATPLPPYPVTNALTRDIRKRAAERGLTGYLSLWAGQGVPLARALPVRELVAALEAETAVALRRLGS